MHLYEFIPIKRQPLEWVELIGTLLRRLWGRCDKARYRRPLHANRSIAKH